MKAWIYICAIVFAAGMVTALADETNTPTGATTNLPANTNEVAVPLPMTATSAPAPAIVHKVKPPVVVPLTLTKTSAVPAQSNITAALLTTTNTITPPPMTTSTSAPAVAGEVRPPEDVSLIQTSAVPAQSNITAAPPPESSGTGRKGVLAIGVAFLAVVGGLTVFMLRRSHKADHASLITRAMNEGKDEDKDTGKHEEKPEEKKPEKEEDKKFPPPMT